MITDYPTPQRREGLSATVVVEFVVDAGGRVLEPIALETSPTPRPRASPNGISAPARSGRRVNIRMRVPIHFKVLDSAE